MRDAFARKSPSMREIFVGKRPSLRDFCGKVKVDSYFMTRSFVSESQKSSDNKMSIPMKIESWLSRPVIYMVNTMTIICNLVSVLAIKFY